MKSVLVFDMDGVLVDVSESYRAAIVEVVRHFTGIEVSRSLIQEYKNRGGWNNDWALSRQLIGDTGGLDIPYETVVQVFQSFFFGSGGDGLVLREKWLPAGGLLQRLSERHSLAIFTGRLLDEARFTLNRFVPDIEWSFIAADDTVARSKPAPDGLLDIEAAHPDSRLLYFGDTVDDARSASGAKVPFIGVTHHGNPGHVELAALLKAEGARAVIENINRIEEIL